MAHLEQSRKSMITAIFLTLEGGCYLSFLVFDLMGRGSLTTPLKYAGLLLCLVYALLSLSQGGDKLVPTALAFTAGADWFLLVRNDHYAVGVGLFLVVQLCYLLRIWRMGGGLALPLRLALPVGLSLVVYALGVANGLTILAMIYFSQLLSNTILAWRCDRKFALGLTLFCCCDLCVGGFQMAGAIPPVLYSLVSVGMWLFYLPSQVLIALSARDTELHSGKNQRSPVMKQNTPPKSSTLMGILETLSIGVLIVSGSIAVPILCVPFYYLHIYALKLPQTTGLTAGEIRQAYNEMLLYCLGRGEFSTGVLPWSESGKSHFTDVRGLFLLDLRLLVGAIVALAVLWLVGKIAHRRAARLLGRGPSFWAGLGLGVVFLAVGVLASRNFTRTFQLFHKVFFPGKTNWVFNPDTDGIITILPEVYFRNCAILILAVLVAGCVWGIVRDLLQRK